MKDSTAFQILPSATVSHSLFKILSFCCSRQLLEGLALFRSLGFLSWTMSLEEHGHNCAELRKQTLLLQSEGKQAMCG